MCHILFEWSRQHFRRSCFAKDQKNAVNLTVKLYNAPLKNAVIVVARKVF
jgi:hypothetical protein